MKRTHWVGILLILAAACAALSLVGAFVVRAQVAAENGKANIALCALRADLERRVEASEDFLDAHPEGFAGITAAQIRMGVQNSKRTIEALSILDCKEDQ